MDKSVFEFHQYKPYLNSKTGVQGTRRGIKSAIAKHLNCQPTYISQIINGAADLSLEQAELLNHFFSHSKDEALYFLLLVQKDRAGTKALRDHFQEQINETQQRRLVLTKRLEPKASLSELNQATYYSSWIYAAVHIGLTIPELQSREALAMYLHLPVRKVTEALDFLCVAGIAAVANDGRYQVTNAHIRLGNDSKNILKHHLNWRVQASESLDREQITDLHYSGVVSLSRADVIKVKNILLDAIRDVQKEVKDSKEEELCAMNIDFFCLKK